MAKVIGIGNTATTAKTTLYDPTCGSGSLLLKAADEARTKISIYGQEMDNATAALARMNMILHDHPSAEIWKDNSLASPHWIEKDGRLKAFDFVVANPPFSTKAWSNGVNTAHDPFERFEDGVPPEKNGDYAFLLHILRSLKSTGKGAVILPHGVLFRGNVEAEIRRNLIRKGFIKGLIGLPANLFYGTGIPACIIVLDKENAAARTGIFMINASAGFVKDGNKNRLRHQDIHKIVDVFTRQLEVPKYARMVARAEIEENDFNLNLPRYIDNTAAEDVQDIAAHLLGGIPDADLDALGEYWDVFPSLRETLFAASSRAGYSNMKVAAAQVKVAIFGHAEFAAYHQATNALFAKWRKQHTPRLHSVKVGDSPKALIATLSEDLLAVFANAHLLDQYDVYQHLMTYWAEVMQDDVYMIVSDGWKAAAQLRRLVEEENKKSKEKPDLVLGKMKLKADLIPPALLVARYFAHEQSEIDALKAQAETFAQRAEELKEEHGSEDGLLAEVLEDGKISKAAVAERLKQIKDEAQAAEERNVLAQYLALLEQEAETNRKAKEAQKALDEKVVKRYGTLTEAEIKTLVIEDKWLARLAADLHGELDRVSQTLTGRIKELAERYAAPLPQLVTEVETLSSKVEAHLQRMGFIWK